MYVCMYVCTSPSGTKCQTDYILINSKWKNSALYCEVYNKQNRLDGTYKRMLRAVLEISQKEHKTNKELHGNLPNITDTLLIRRLRFIGHCWRKKDEVISELLLWEPKHGARKRGRPATTYVNQLRNDTGLSIAELKSIMGNRKEWMKLLNRVRVRSK